MLKGLSGNEIAGRAGVAQSQLSKIERDASSPSAAAVGAEWGFGRDYALFMRSYADLGLPGWDPGTPGPWAPLPAGAVDPGFPLWLWAVGDVADGASGDDLREVLADTGALVARVLAHLVRIAFAPPSGSDAVSDAVLQLDAGERELIALFRQIGPADRDVALALMRRLPTR